MSTQQKTVSYETIYGQTEDVLEASFAREGTALDLTGATVTLTLTSFASGTETTYSLTLDADPTTGIATYDWANGYPSEGPGRYWARYTVVRADSDILYVPNSETRELFVFWAA